VFAQEQASALVRQLAEYTITLKELEDNLLFRLANAQVGEELPGQLQAQLQHCLVARNMPCSRPCQGTIGAHCCPFQSGNCRRHMPATAAAAAAAAAVFLTAVALNLCRVTSWRILS
jgi:hypothetical protein